MNDNDRKIGVGQDFDADDDKIFDYTNTTERLFCPAEVVVVVVPEELAPHAQEIVDEPPLAPSARSAEQKLLPSQVCVVPSPSSPSADLADILHGPPHALCDGLDDHVPELTDDEFFEVDLHDADGSDDDDIYLFGPFCRRRR